MLPQSQSGTATPPDDPAFPASGEPTAASGEEEAPASGESGALLSASGWAPLHGRSPHADRPGSVSSFVALSEVSVPHAGRQGQTERIKPTARTRGWATD